MSRELIGVYHKYLQNKSIENITACTDVAIKLIPKLNRLNDCAHDVTIQLMESKTLFYKMYKTTDDDEIETLNQGDVYLNFVTITAYYDWLQSEECTLFQDAKDALYEKILKVCAYHQRYFDGKSIVVLDMQQETFNLYLLMMRLCKVVKRVNKMNKRF